MSDPGRPTGEPLGAPPADGAPSPRSGVWNGVRSGARAVPDPVASGVERELARYAWRSGVPLDPDERHGVGIDPRT